jgi:hypothetical protein
MNISMADSPSARRKRTLPSPGMAARQHSCSSPRRPSRCGEYKAAYSALTGSKPEGKQLDQVVGELYALGLGGQRVYKPA